LVCLLIFLCLSGCIGPLDVTAWIAMAGLSSQWQPFSAYGLAFSAQQSAFSGSVVEEPWRKANQQSSRRASTARLPWSLPLEDNLVKPRTIPSLSAFLFPALSSYLSTSSIP
jgi:hypothetical protein